MKQTFLLLVLALGMHSIDMSAQSKELQKTKDGFEWYLVSQNGKYGATDANGKTLIPIEYDKCVYQPLGDSEKEGGFGCFKVKKGDYIGAYSIEGVNVIPLSRQYIGLRKDWGKNVGAYFVVLLENGCFGTCDVKGNVVTILKEAGVWPLACFDHGLFYYWTVKDDENGPTRMGLADIHGTILSEPKYCGFEVDDEDGRFYGEDCEGDKKFNVCSTKKIDTFQSPFK